MLQRSDQRAPGVEGWRHRPTLHEDRGVALLHSGVDDAGFWPKQTVEPGAHALSQLSHVGAGRECRQQFGDAVVEGVALLEEDAVDLGAQPAVGRDNEGGERQREHDLAGFWVDADEARSGVGDPGHGDESPSSTSTML